MRNTSGDGQSGLLKLYINDTRAATYTGSYTGYLGDNVDTWYDYTFQAGDTFQITGSGVSGVTCEFCFVLVLL